MIATRCWCRARRPGPTRSRTQSGASRVAGCSSAYAGGVCFTCRFDGSWSHIAIRTPSTRWRDKPDGKHDVAAAVYVPPELVFKALVLPPPPPPPPPPQSASASSSPTEAGSPASAATPTAAPSSVRVVPLTVEAPDGFFPPNPIQVRRRVLSCTWGLQNSVSIDQGSSTQTNHQILGGGHPDFLLLGWSHIENAPPALETREQLQSTSYQFIRVMPAPAGDGAGAEATCVLQVSVFGGVLGCVR
jgi:hypothetical protein